MTDAPPPLPTSAPASVARLAPGTVSPVRLAALRTGAVLARVEAALVALTGPGAVSAAQGLLTNDVEKPGDGAFVYGALLTPKGMIVVDAWTSRLGSTVSFTVPAEGRERALAIFTRSVPPRLARLADRTAELAVYRLAGRSRGRSGRRRDARARAHSGGLAAPRRRSRRQNDPAGGPLRRAGRRVLHQGVLHRPGNRLAPPLPRPHQPLPARPPVRRRAARRPGGRVEQRDAPRSRRRSCDEPRLGARERRRGRGPLDRARADSPRGGVGCDGARRGPRRA